MPSKKTDLVGLLAPLVEGDELRASYKRRRDAHDYQKVSPGDEKKYLQDGWVIHKKMQAHTWMKRPKSSEAMLEDRIWSLFYRMGYSIPFAKCRLLPRFSKYLQLSGISPANFNGRRVLKAHARERPLC